jgi:hypothetical protein
MLILAVEWSARARSGGRLAHPITGSVGRREPDGHRAVRRQLRQSSQILAGANMVNQQPALRATAACGYACGFEQRFADETKVEWRVLSPEQHGERVMLVTFKCRSAPDVLMLENLARYLVGIVGKDLGKRGVITHDELDSAIAKLEAAIVIEKKESAQKEGHFHEGEDGHERHELPIGLAQRAFPFLDMLRAAKRDNTDVIWGV